MDKWNDLQIININNDTAFCRHCNTNILDIENFVYDSKTISEPIYWEELCRCNNCNHQFILHYDIFDNHGHIYQRVFSEDLNNPNYHWQEGLIESQRIEIENHIKNCQICCDRLSQEILTDAWLKDIMKELKQKLKNR